MSETIDKIKKITLENDIKGKVAFDYNLSTLSWFGVAGKAEVFYTPDSSKELTLLLKLLPPKINRTVIGMGSNLLIRDGGIDGLIIKLGKNFSGIDIEGDLVRVGSSVPYKVFISFADINEISFIITFIFSILSMP